MDIKSRKFVRVSAAIVIALVGIVTTILAIVRLAGKGSVDPDKAVCYSLGAAAAIIGLAGLVIGLSKENVEKNTSDFIGSALCISIAILFFLPTGSKFMKVLILEFVPLAIASLGGVFFAKSIVALIKKENTTKCIIMLLLSVAGLICGVLLYVYKDRPTLQNIEWMLIGISIFTIGISYLLSVIKNKQFNPLKKDQ